jgi:hypothetical protein
MVEIILNHSCRIITNKEVAQCKVNRKITCKNNDYHAFQQVAIVNTEIVCVASVREKELKLISVLNWRLAQVHRFIT